LKGTTSPAIVAGITPISKAAATLAAAFSFCFGKALQKPTAAQRLDRF